MIANLYTNIEQSKHMNLTKLPVHLGELISKGLIGRDSSQIMDIFLEKNIAILST